LGQVALFFKQKCELTWSLSWAFGRSKIGQVLSQPKWRNFRSRNKVLSVAALYRYINSADHSDEQTTKSAIRKECDHHVWVHLFGLTNKATWPKSLTSGTKINCNAYFLIRGLPVSIVWRISRCLLFCLLQNTLHHSQKVEFFRSFRRNNNNNNNNKIFIYRYIYIYIVLRALQCFKKIWIKNKNPKIIYIYIYIVTKIQKKNLR